MTEDDISKLSYEQALNELEKVVATLESGSSPLDQSIELYSRGAMLKDHCQKKLNAAEEKISVIVQKSEDNSLEIKPFSNT